MASSSTRTLALLCLGLALAGGASAQDAADAPAARLSLEELLQDLAVDDFARRAAATAELERRGESIADALRRAREKLPLEARLRVDEILEGIALARRRVPAGFAATRVTVDLHDRPLDEILQALAAASGSRIRRAVPNAASQRGASLSVKELPLLQALDELCRLESLMRYREHPSGDILINESQTTVPAPPVVYPGPLRVALVSYSINRQLRFDGTRSTTSYLQIQVEAESRAHLIGILGPILASRVEDDREQSLLPDLQTRNPYLLRATGKPEFHASISLLPPSPDATHLAVVEVPLDVLVPSEVAVASLLHPHLQPTPSSPPGSDGPEPAAPGEGLGLRLETMQDAGDNKVITISFVAPPVETPAPPGTQATWEEIRVFDPQGRDIRPIGVQSRRSPDGRQVRSLTLTTGAVSEIRVRCLTRFRTEKVTARFTDVEIP